MSTERAVLDQILEDLGAFSDRPFDFVMYAFPWGEPGTDLAKRTGPEPWQREVLLGLQNKLLNISQAIQIAVRSGHNIGKSAFVCWMILWAISTRPDTKGVVTANTEKQLRLKLWTELHKWHRLFIGHDMFEVSATAIHARDPARRDEWRIDAIPWSEDNPEAFAGLHNFSKRVLVIFDEASAIVDKIWETIDGVMNEAETELIWVATGNPTRNTGRFRECFEPGGQGQFWSTHKVDSREVSFTDHDRINKLLEMWGEDSDWAKVRILGEFPSAGANQLIDSETIRLAMARPPEAQHWEPLIMTVDVARQGMDSSVIIFRRGKDAKSIPATHFKGLTTIELGQQCAALIAQRDPDAVFIDEGGIGAGVVDYVRHLGHNVIGVQFGSKPSIPLSGERAHNKRAEMYLSLRHWLRSGGSIENSEQLFKELVAQEYAVKKDSILLTPKEDQDESPDWADSLAMSFAYPTSKRQWGKRGNKLLHEYDPCSQAAFQADLTVH